MGAQWHMEFILPLNAVDDIKVVEGRQSPNDLDLLRQTLKAKTFFICPTTTRGGESGYQGGESKQTKQTAS